ncbi:hypothetical protein HPB50_020365 [Hyalomma asiaticum]|uniref:Uncharacterized protein n=1 Tax=Hyalomma asiaticum TaxID=266040 RepID=A0ACB7SRH7_HYAAI|nr:hypothetical protein HPB50_020365 [Hyalomma asiaticum]
MAYRTPQKMERERGTELQAQVGEALQREKANADLLERMMRERERRTELEERVKVLIAPDTDSERCEAKEKGGIVSGRYRQRQEGTSRGLSREGGDS